MNEVVSPADGTLAGAHDQASQSKHPSDAASLPVDDLKSVARASLMAALAEF